MLNVDSQLSIGLYQIDLWELSSAQHYFENVIITTQGTRHQAWAEKASVALALIYSYLGKTEAAAELLKPISDLKFTQTTNLQSGRFAYFIQLMGQTYNNLGALEIAQALYARAIAFAETSHYAQVKARALTGFAELSRKQGQYENAYQHHTQAIKLLDDIGALCDLGEAYFQLGLTMQSDAQRNQDDTVQAVTHLKQAIQIFRQISYHSCFQSRK